MTPESLVIDRRFRGVGRLKKASGTRNPAIKRKLNRMLTALADEGRLDILRAIRQGRLSIMQVHDAYQRRALDSLPTATTLRPLVETMRAWIAALETDEDCSHQHVVSLRQSARYIERTAPSATLHDAPAVVEQLRESLGRAHPRSFNLLRAHVLAFIRDELKRNDPLWSQVAAIRVKKVKRKEPRALLTPDRMRELFPNAATDLVDAVAWGMVTTGMHSAEYWGRWSVRADRIHIEGTKRKGRVRDVPLVAAPPVPQLPRVTWEKTLRARKTGVQPYDFRRSYVQWLEEAGVPRTRRKLYLGHGAEDVTSLYERHEVSSYLAADATRMIAYIGLSPRAVRLVREETA